MKHRVVLASVAELQLSQAALWWATHRDLGQGLRWLEAFEAAIATLAVNPERLPKIIESDRHDWPHVYRQLLFGIGKRSTHRAIFRIQGDAVFVVAIRHLAQRELTPEDL